MIIRKIPVPLFVLPLVFSMAMAFSSVNLMAQGDESTAPKGLSEQFQELKDQSESYNEYKVIRTYKLNEFWKSVTDTLSAYQSDLRLANNEIGLLKDEIKSLKSELDQTKSQLTLSEARNDEIMFLGIDINKSVYNIIVWGIIGGLAIVLITLYSSYKKSHKVTRTAKKDFETVSSDFENYKKKAQEKQIKLKRELQTEINRVEELLDKYERNGVHSR